MEDSDTGDLKEIPQGELRDSWVRLLNERTELTCDDVRRLLREEGLKARGANYKAEIRNLHSAATNDPRIAKVRPGVFGLANFG